MNNKILNVGIAGYGVVGRRRREFIDKHPSMRTVAVCDRTLNGSGTLPDGTTFYADYQALLARPDLDALFVCLTNDIAPQVTIAGLQAGLHVFCEKPPGRTVVDIAGVREVEACYPDLKLMYGFNHRYHESIRDALDIINSGELGALLNLRGVYGKAKLVTFNQSDWRTKRKIAGGGVLLDQGIHLVDLMRLFAGEFSDIHSFVSNAYWKYDVEDNAYALMRTKKGVVALLHSSATQWRHRFSLDMNLERGSINLSGILSGSKSYGAETMTVVWADPDDDQGDPKEKTTRYNKDPSWEQEIAAFGDAILKNSPIINGTSDDALKTMELVHAIYCADPEWCNRYGLKQGA